MTVEGQWLSLPPQASNRQLKPALNHRRLRRGLSISRSFVQRDEITIFLEDMSSEKLRILVLGGSGFLGEAVCHALKDHASSTPVQRMY